MYTLAGKRIIDFIVALVGFMVLLPVFLILTLLLCWANQGKPFFFQKRPGKNGRIFHIIKFKTMNDKKDANGDLLPDAARMTAVGDFMRKTSLDEIPQLLNILKGDMSLIGPRPLLPSYLEYYNDEEMERLAIRPGMTGLTGVKGRNNIAWYDKMYYDIKYVRNLSFRMDVYIFFTTIKKVLIRDGVSKEGFVTTDSFIDFCKQMPVRTYETA